MEGNQPLARITPVFNCPKLNDFRCYLQDPATSVMYGLVRSNVFWRDNDNPQGHGPFESIFQCMEHYNWMQKATVNEPYTKEFRNRVIEVDFVYKRRIFPQEA